MSESLVAFDTDHIKSYVFGTSRLKEIRGASALLDKLNRIDMPDRAPDGPKAMVFANGGAGLFVVDSSQADQFVRAVQRVYRAHGASITGVSVDLPYGAAGNVSAYMDTLRYRLRAAKDSVDDPVSPVTHPLLHFCNSCGTGYASTAGADGELLCQICVLKRWHNERVADDIRQWTHPHATPDAESPYLWERLIASLRQAGYPTDGYSRPDDFEALGEQSTPKGYLGLIYADGDGMGHEIEQIATLSGMSLFARAVDDAIHQTAVEAIRDHLKPQQGRTWPFDILLLGGDDLVMVTRAQSAIQVALAIVERFPELTRSSLGRKLGVSASVVLAHVNFPIGSLLDLAQSGLKFAKRAAAKRRLSGEDLSGGLLNFMVVSSANHLDFGEYYSQVLRAEEIDGTELRRTKRPYTAADMHALLKQIQSVRAVPANKLEQLRAAVFKSRKQGTIDTMKAVLRLRNAQQREALLKLVGGLPQEQLYLPWAQQGAGKWVTPVLDIVELLDFIEQQEIQA